MVWEPHRYEFVRASYHDEAEYLGICLDLDLVRVAQVIAWADELVATLPRPPIEVIDLALMTTQPADEVVSALGKVSRAADKQAVALQVLGLLRRRFDHGDTDDALGRMLSGLGRYFYGSEELREWLFHESWALRQSHLSGATRDEVRDRLAALLKERGVEDFIGPTLGL